MVSGQTVCGFRDSAYLYYPLFKWIDSVWAVGEIPLWNPYCNYGLPIVGDGSSSVFYPGKLIFLCRFLSYPSRYGIYLSIHVLIAAAGAYRFACAMKANQAGATLAAVSYAFGGSVLFQVTNIIYLVSAAWLPFALAFVWRGVLGGDWRSSIWAGVVCALMILGGDPQMVYHIGLIAAVSVMFRFWKRRRWLLKKSRSSSNESYRWLTAASARLTLMVIVTSCLAAIQILPTAHWAERSERAASGEISNVMQAWDHTQKVSEPRIKPRYRTVSPSPNLKYRTWQRLVRIEKPPIANLDSTLAKAFFSSPQAGSQKDATYQFSQPPWSIAELFFPNVMGKPFPTHQRWSDALPGAERIWTPSIYAGVLTILLALSQFRLWGKRKRHVWLSRIAMFFAFASFGWFGLVWLLNEGLAVVGLSDLEIGGIKIGPHVGGLYWFMATFLPKYFMFRYPAKLFVIASLMISVLAGLGITNTSPKRKRVNSWLLSRSLARASGLYSGVVVATVCLLGLIALQIVPVDVWLGRIRPNLFFGPLDVAATTSALHLSFAHALIVIAALFALMWLVRTLLNAATFLTVLIVLLTAIDVTIANRWLLADVDSNVFEAPTKIGRQLEQLKTDAPNSIPRIYRSFDVQARNQTWPRETSLNRLEEIVTWQRETLFPKHHLEYDVALLGSFGSVWPSVYDKFGKALDRHFIDDPVVFVMQSKRFRIAGQMSPDRSSDSLHLSLYSNAEQAIDHEIELLPPLVRSNSSAPAVAHYNSAGSTDQAKIISTIRTWRTNIVEIDSDHECRTRIHILHDDGWQATAQNLETSKRKDLEIIPSRDGIGMNVSLPPGHHRVTFTYSPREFWIGCWVSVFAWSMLAVAIIASNAKRKKHRPA